MSLQALCASQNSPIRSGPVGGSGVKSQAESVFRNCKLIERSKALGRPVDDQKALL